MPRIPKRLLSRVNDSKKAKDIEIWDGTRAVVARIEAEINEIQSPVRTLQKEVEEHEKELSAIQTRLTAMNSEKASRCLSWQRSMVSDLM